MPFDDIRAYFITTTKPNAENAARANAGAGASGEDCSTLSFANALKLMQQQIPEDSIRQMRASEAYALIASGKLTKKDVFILDHFEGDFFKQLQLTKALIVGPPCIVTCIMMCEPIPLGASPVFSTAMRNLQISASSLTTAEKERIRTQIQWMGGYYFQNLGRSITHLISNSIKSNKYEHATLNGIPVMHVDWVQQVWERSYNASVKATDIEFDKYRLPIFFSANITCTGLDSEKKNNVMRIVNENGGTYHRAFRSQLVDIVITEQSKTNSEKYKAALRFNKEILMPEWIFDSVQKGYALPTKGYVVRALKEVSTPTKTYQPSADQTQLSEISCINHVPGAQRMGSNMTTVDETICITLNSSAASNSAKNKTSKDLLKKATTTSASAHYRNAFEEISARQAKKAGNFLDGCSIYLGGFLSEEREKLNRILNVGGATRYDELNSEVTHIIVGQLDDVEFRCWQKGGLLSDVHIVRLDWLLECIKAGHYISEAPYRIPFPTSQEPDMPSPSSKRTLRSMNHSFKQPEMPVKKKLFNGKGSSAKLVDKRQNDTLAGTLPIAQSTEIPMIDKNDEQDLLAQYSQEHEAAAGAPLPPPAATTDPDQTISQALPVASSTQINIAAPTVAAATKDASNTAQAQLAADLAASGMASIDFEKLDYFQGASVYVEEAHFPEYYTQMISECEAAHGNIVSQSFADPVDYAIVSFERTFYEAQLPVKSRHVVTELYVECCMKENKLVPIEYYHKPIPHTADNKPLKGMTIVISIYSGLERDFIDSIAQLLGARVNKAFMKKEKPLLVCSSAEGSKYGGAIKWCYPIVNSQWLVECAAKGEKLSFAKYLVGDSAPDFPISPTQERSSIVKTKASKNSLKASVEIEQLDADYEVENQHLTPQPQSTPQPLIATEMTPLRNKRVSELAGGSSARNATRQSLSDGGSSGLSGDSPHTPINNFTKASYNFDFMEDILTKLDNDEERELVREVINEMRSNQTPELERIRRQACTPINGQVRTPIGIPEFCLTPEFQKRMADDFERRYRLPTKKAKPATPIDEIRKRVLRITCEALGIPYDEASINDTNNKDIVNTSEQRLQVTPSGKSNSSFHANEESSVGLLSKTVSAKSIKSSANENDGGGNVTPVQHKSSHIGRTLFKHTSRSDSSGGIAGGGIGNATDNSFVPNTQSPESIHMVNPIASLGKSTIDFDKISFEETEAANSTTSRRSSSLSKSTTTTTTAISSPEVKQIQEYLKNCESRRQSLKRTHNSNANMNCDLESEVHFVQPFESEQFGVGTEHMVGWRDPTECSARQRRRMSPSMQHQGTPRFSISCSDELRTELIDKIVHLGGEVCENLAIYDPTSTHFICERPNRAEKMLGSIASGKWVLSVKYIDECYAKDVFIDEELFEWGNAKALNLPQLTTDEQTIVSAAHRWRIELNAQNCNIEGGGAFSRLRVILSIAERNYDAIKTVLKAGGAEIIDVRPPFSIHNKTETATHCFVDVKKAPINAQDYRFLKEHNVLVLSQMYINAYLMNGKHVDKQKYQVSM